MALKTKYITPDEFKEYTGIDLDAKLTDHNAIGFLKRIEVRMAAYLDANYCQNIEAKYPNFNEKQKQDYKYALLEQSLYVFKNGDIGVDSGYDPEKGVVASKETLHQLVLSDFAKEHLMNCGLLSNTIKAGHNDLFWWVND